MAPTDLVQFSVIVAFFLGVVSGSTVPPNIILILSDDQSNMLDSISHMPKLKSLIIDGKLSILIKVSCS